MVNALCYILVTCNGLGRWQGLFVAIVIIRSTEGFSDLPRIFCYLVTMMGLETGLRAKVRPYCVYSCFHGLFLTRAPAGSGFTLKFSESQTTPVAEMKRKLCWLCGSGAIFASLIEPEEEEASSAIMLQECMRTQPSMLGLWS